MTPLEELQAAHKRLSELRQLSGGRAWKLGANDPGEGWWDVDEVETRRNIAVSDHPVVAALIVTLHSTIDAQLTLLHGAMNFAFTGSVSDLEELDRSGFEHGVLAFHALSVARAINGEAIFIGKNRFSIDK